jgi:predicted enzyme related to lactoylglutathione lyase
VFGWEFFTGETDTTGYLHIKSGEAIIGGIPPALLSPPGTPAHWMLYFSAQDAEALTAKASSLGGKTLMPTTEVPNTGKFSIVQDPQGAAFALFQAVTH